MKLLKRVDCSQDTDNSTWQVCPSRTTHLRPPSHVAKTQPKPRSSPRTSSGHPDHPTLSVVCIASASVARSSPFCPTRRFQMNRDDKKRCISTPNSCKRMPHQLYTFLYRWCSEVMTVERKRVAGDRPISVSKDHMRTSVIKPNCGGI